MKIAFDAKRLFLNRTGLGNYSRFYINSIISYLEKDDEVVLFSPKKGPYFSEIIGNKSSVSYIYPQGLWKILHPIWRVFRISGISKQAGVQIFHGLSNELPAGLKRTGVKSVVTIHDVIFLRYPNYYHPINRFIYNFKTKKTIKVADLIIAISQQTKDDLMHFYGVKSDKIKVVYQDCDPIFHQEYSEDAIQAAKEKYQLPDKYMLCVGSIESRKNQLMLVKALKHLPESVHLVLVGKQTDYIDTVLDYVKGANLSSRVRIISNAKWNDFPLLYKNSSVFVYSSQFEGFGIPLVEAMNTGVPIVSVNASCFPEVCQDAALYVNPDNEKELAEKVNLLLNDSSLQQFLRQKGFERAKAFRPENTMPEMIKLYKKLLN